MATELKLMTDADIENGARGRVTNNRDVNLHYADDDNNVSLEYYRMGGLYDPRIFGMANRCACRKTNIAGVVCPVCGVRVLSEEDYMRSYGFYRMNYPYILDIKIPGLVNKIREYFTLKGQYLKDLWSIAVKMEPVDDFNTPMEGWTFIRDKNNRKFRCMLDELPDVEDPNETYALEYYGLMGLLTLSNYYTASNESLEFIRSYINYDLVVPSPQMRPISKMRVGGQDTLTFHKLTIDYRNIIAANEMLPDMIDVGYKRLVDKLTLCFFLNHIINTMTKDNELLMPSKKSFVRNIIDTRAKKSIRSTIVCAMDLKMNQVYIPQKFAYQALQMDIIQGLLRKYQYMNDYDCIMMYKQKTKEAMDMFYEIVNNSMVTMVRNPSLHKFNLQAFYPLIWDEIAIGFPIEVHKAFNADFDGDTAYIQFFTDPTQCAQLQDMTPDKNWFYEKKYDSQIDPTVDTVYGILLATKVIEPSNGMRGFKSFKDAEEAYKSGDLNVNEKIMLHDKATTYGREKIKKIVGLDIDVLTGPDKPMTSKETAKLISAMGYHDNRVEEFKQLADFANEVTTLVGYGPMPFEDVMIGDKNKIKEILSGDEDMYVKRKNLRQYLQKELKNEIAKLPESSLEDIQKVNGKAKLDKLVNLMGPSITTDNQGVLASSESVYSGLTERDYNNLAKENREAWALKQAGTPVSGYNQRQLTNLELSLIYCDKIGSPDKTGIILEGKDALGRTRLDGSIIKNIVQGKVTVKSCINNPTNVVYKDEIAAREFVDDSKLLGRRMYVPDGSAIGVSYASAVTEQTTQGLLGLKHGVTVEDTEQTIVKAIEGGVVEELDDRYITIHGVHKYSYIITKSTIVYSKVKVGAAVNAGDPILKHNRRTTADRTLAIFNTLTLTNVTKGSPGQYLETSECTYALSTGTIKYKSFNEIEIGGKTYKFNESDMMLLPIGYTVKEKFERLSNGIPDMNNILRTSGSVADTYYVFYYCISLYFPGMSSEPFETLFKCLYRNDFSVIKGIESKSAMVDKLYFGSTKNTFKTEIANAQTTVNRNGKVETAVKIDEGIILPMILGSHYLKDTMRN